MLSGETTDPRDLDYARYTHQKITSNPDGTPSLIEYYLDYAVGTNSFNRLAVRAQFTYETVPVVRTTENIEWFYENGSPGVAVERVKVYE